MSMLESHFWVVGLLVMGLNLGIGRVRMRTLIAEGRLTERDANRFCVRAAVALIAVFGAFEALSVASGTLPHCQMLLPLTDRAAWPFHLLTLLFGVGLLYWVWNRGGDRTLALVAPAFSRGPTAGKTYSPARVRLVLSAVVVLGWGGYLVARLALPMPVEMPGCLPSRYGAG